MSVVNESHIRLKRWVRVSISVVFAAAFAVAAIHHTSFGHAQAGTVVANATTGFTYGFDFTDQGPDAKTQDTVAQGNDPQAVMNALNVLVSFKGSMMDQSIYSFGAQHNPEPTAGTFDLSSIDSRIGLINTAGGNPVITLVQAPTWMYTGCSGLDPNSMNLPSTTFHSPPCPSHYQDFAALCAHIATAYPQVKYFAVWSEMRGFYSTQTASIDATNYTAMYNDVYAAIKAVRPDAQVGGPYATMSAYSTVQPHSTASTLHGSWGYIDASAQTALSYWIAHNVGADFLAIDGGTEIAKDDNANLTDPLNASQKYAAVDQWIKSQTNLPIWWMESHIAPSTGWNDQIGAAARVATLALMSTSGASVGLQWQPQGQLVSINGAQVWPDEGLWTSTLNPGGGQPTILGSVLPGILPFLKQSLTILPGQPTGVLAVESSNQLLLVNTNGATATAAVNSNSISLTAGAISLRSIPATPASTPPETTPPSTPTGTPSGTGTTAIGSTTTSSGSGAAGGSASNPITASIVTLAPPAADAGKIASVSYSIDNKFIAKSTKPPFTYNVKTNSLTNGCHTLATTTNLLDGTSKTTTQQLCVKNASAWQSAAWVKAFGIGILVWIVAVVAWLLFGLPHFARGVHRLPGGHHLVHVTHPVTAAVEPPKLIHPS